MILALLLACTSSADDTDRWFDGTCGTPGESYADGLRKTGLDRVFDLVLLEADPRPPDRGWNTWQVQIVESRTDVPVTGAAVVVEPRMPQHDHGTTPATFTLTETDGGTYVTPEIHLFMSGLWHVRFDVARGAETDEISFTFCLEG